MTEVLLRVRDLTVRFASRRARLAGPRRWLTAVDSVDLEVGAGRAMGIVGESGCGKSTLARAILGLVEPHAGTVQWRGQPVRRSDPAALQRMRREAQIVFQDPVGSLDPRMNITESVAEALEALAGPQERTARAERIAQALEEVGLDPALGRRYPHELSGGQCQRAAIARAIVARPRLLVCDEAVSALDVSVQAQIVNLLADLRERHGMALLFISHNLAVVRHLCDEVAVLYLGRVVEQATSAAIFARPRHPYTRALLAAVPHPDPTSRCPDDPTELRSAGIDSADPGPGCAYAPRCAFAEDLCRVEPPRLVETGAGHLSACPRWQVLVPPGGSSQPA